MKRTVAIIILAWNRWALTERLLESIRRHTDLTGARVVVVDNGSTDETSSQLSRYPWLETIRHETNLGFVRGNNAAIRSVGSDTDVLLLNNDVEILHDGWLEGLREAAYSAPDVGIAGCRLVMGDGRLLHAGTWIRPDNCWGQQIASNERNLDQYGETRRVEGIVFACAWIRREVIDAIGLLDEDFFSYFEDTDYCLRAAERGFATVCCGNVTLRHDEHGSTSSEPSAWTEMFEKSRATFRRKWQKRLEQRYTSTLSWQSIMNVPTGYAMSTREILRALDEDGVRTTYSYAYGPGTPLPIAEEGSSGDALLDVIRSRRDPAQPPVAVTYAQGDVFHRNRGRYRIGYTMIEVDGFDREWVRQANEMDEIWTPTGFNRAGLLASGVRRPVHVVPLGVDTAHFHPGVRRIPNPSGDFVFLANFEWGERKAAEVLLQGFNRAFRRSEPAILVCKINNRDAGVDVRNEIGAMGLDEEGGRIYFIWNRELPHYELAALYRSADCFVSPSRGEGWGLPLLEAMACGLPAIATNWGGHTAILDESDTYPLRIRGLVGAESKCPYYRGFSWADPDPEHLTHLLRHVYENQEEARARGLRAADRVQRTLTWGDTARVIRRHLDRIGR